ncbi:MAG TPA: NAD(P)-dependent oxidoreductase [Candidatus Saccharimonadales bacterium]|jgi:dTDP-4-dehydrorhamnose 3,5-epimerase|nr:NAD(P)-dependent oxidoreductase [Candidatus Saccharimonadales bacterium]
MDESRFLIVGANGQLGKALQAKFPRAIAVDRTTIDIGNWATIEAYDWAKVDVILNAAAYTNVDGAETDEGRLMAWKINATAMGYLAKVATVHDITLVHISSDYVFDGTRRNHPETEDLAPLGVYGQTKAAGDIAASTTPKHYILRAAWVIGEGQNFVRIMTGLAAKDISPTVVSDQVGRLTFTTTLADAIDHLLQTKADYGTYNVTNDGEPASWADITRIIFKELGRDDLTVTDTSTKEYFMSKEHVAPRPLDSQMDLSKIKATGLQPRDWHDDLHAYIQAEKAQSKEQL